MPFFILYELRKALGIEIIGVHVNHGLRGEAADGDEAFVREICEERGVPLEIRRYNLESTAKKWKQSMEEAGRNLRREAFCEAADRYGAAKIALAHHKNDNAETFLMNLARGTGLGGMTGIAPAAGKWIHPLLGVSRGEIEAYLADRGIPYRTDATNLTEDYTRNKIRNRIFPYMEREINAQTVSHINEAIEQLSMVRELLERQVSGFENRCVVRTEKGLCIQKAVFDAGEKVLQNAVIHRVLEQTAGSAKDIAAVHVEAVASLMEKQTGKGVSLPYRMRAVRVYEGVRVERAGEMGGGWDRHRGSHSGRCAEKEYALAVPGQVEAVLQNGDRYTVRCSLCERAEGAEDFEKAHRNPEKSNTKCFDYAIIRNTLCVRTRRPGDYLVIDGEGRRQKLKSYFINAKIPSDERDRILLIADGSHILWVAGLRSSYLGRVYEHTKRILKIQIDAGGEENGRDN